MREREREREREKKTVRGTMSKPYRASFVCGEKHSKIRFFMITI